MAKVRSERSAVVPPLPGDSPVRAQFVRAGVYAPDHAVYELRPFPGSAEADDDLKPFIDSKGYADWPEVEELSDLKQFSGWLVDESFTRSFALAYRYDGQSGVVLNFPLFIVRNFEVPMSGGWIVNRIYFKGSRLADFGYNLLYTTSASRWVDGYFALGVEIEGYDTPEGRAKNRRVEIFLVKKSPKAPQPGSTAADRLIWPALADVFGE